MCYDKVGTWLWKACQNTEICLDVTQRIALPGNTGDQTLDIFFFKWRSSFCFCCIDVISIPGMYHTFEDITVIITDGINVIPLRKNTISKSFLEMPNTVQRHSRKTRQKADKSWFSAPSNRQLSSQSVTCPDTSQTDSETFWSLPEQWIAVSPNVQRWIKHFSSSMFC